MVSTGTGKQENLEKWKGIFQSGNFVKTGKVMEFTQNTGKIKKLYWKFEKNTGKVREICQPVEVKTLQIWYHTLNEKKNSKKYWKSQGNLSLRKSGKHDFIQPGGNFIGCDVKVDC